MIPFLDLKSINAQYRQELIEACTNVIDSGWYIQGRECKEFEKEFSDYCGTKYSIGVANNLIPPHVSKSKINFIYASEADLLNVALFGKTAKNWQNSNPDKKGNMRDYATVEQLVVLANLESLNAEFIKQGFSPEDRLERLNAIAIEQMGLLLGYQKRFEK